MGAEADPVAEAHADALKARYQALIAAATSERSVEVIHVFSPRDTGDDVEVLFLAGPPDDREPCTAYIGDDEDEPVLIASGW